MRSPRKGDKRWVLLADCIQGGMVSKEPLVSGFWMLVAERVQASVFGEERAWCLPGAPARLVSPC